MRDTPEVGTVLKWSLFARRGEGSGPPVPGSSVRNRDVVDQWAPSGEVTRYGVEVVETSSLSLSVGPST